MRTSIETKVNSRIKATAKALLKMQIERCDGCDRKFRKGDLIRDEHDATLLYCDSCHDRVNKSGRP